MHDGSRVDYWQTSEAVAAAGEGAVARLLELEAAGKNPNAGRYLSLLGLRDL
jgi:hypothetical protein|eukprot:COSAG06_NODE_7291_length_2556_cov_1.244200_4_plen_52_part_00